MFVRAVGRPDAQHVVGGDEPQRRHPRALHPPRQQHAERLVRVAALEAVRHQVPAVAAGKRLHQQVVAPGHARPRPLQLQPVPHLIGEQPPARRILQQPAHAIGEVGGQRHAAAFIGRHHGLAGAALGAFHRHLVQAQELQQAAGEHEGVAGAQQAGEVFLDFAQHRPEPLFPHQAHLQQRRLDDGADVHAVLRGDAGAAHVHAALAVAEQFAPAIVSGQRVAAVLHERQHVVEVLPGQRGIGRGAAHLGIRLVRQERRGARQAEQMLRQHVQPAGTRRIAVQFARGDAEHGGLAFQHLEPVGGHQDGAAGLVHAVVGAADALQQPGHAFRRADLDDLVHPAPVDAQIERRRRHHRAQLARRHRGFDAAALLHLQASRDAARSAASGRSASTAPGTSARPERGC